MEEQEEDAMTNDAEAITTSSSIIVLHRFSEAMTKKNYFQYISAICSGISMVNRSILALLPTFYCLFEAIISKVLLLLLL